MLGTTEIEQRYRQYTLAVIGLWAIYCFLMAVSPQPFAIVELRAVARVSIVLVPAILFYWRGDKKQSIFDYFLLRKNWKKGVAVGIAVPVIYFSLGWMVAFRNEPFPFKLPTGFAVWLNFILGSPLAEEAFFRGVLFQEIQKIRGTTQAVVVSSLAFAMLHLPQWLFSGSLEPVAILSSFATIFFYGVVFAVLVSATRSLWAALIPHWLNNFIGLAIKL